MTDHQIIAHMPNVVVSLGLVLACAVALWIFIMAIAWYAKGPQAVLVRGRDPLLFRDQWQEARSSYLRDLQTINTERMREQPMGHRRTR